MGLGFRVYIGLGLGFRVLLLSRFTLALKGFMLVRLCWGQKPYYLGLFGLFRCQGGKVQV